MSDEEAVVTETPSGEAEDGGGSEDASQIAEVGAQEGLQGTESTEAASAAGGEAAGTTTPAGDDILQHPKVQEAISRLQSTKDTELAAVKREMRELREGLQKPADQRPDERAQIQARLQELEAHLEVNAYDSTAQREAARLEARLEVMDRLGQQDQQQNFRAARDQGFAALKEKAPVLWAAEDSEEWPKAQELAGQMKTASQRHGLEGHPHEALLAYALVNLNQRGQEVEAAKAQGSLAEQTRQKTVAQKGQLGTSKAGKTAGLGLSSSEMETVNQMKVPSETFARVRAQMKKGVTVDA